MVVRKILESTLIAGASSVTFTDTDIPNSLLRVYCTKPALFPISQTLSGNSVSVNYKPQDSNIGVALEIVKSGLDIVDDLVTDDSSKALSANQGYVLKGLIDDIVIPEVPENITDLDDVEVTDITNNQVLAWDSINSKFKNVDQSGGGGGGEVYSDQETVVGTITLQGVTKKVYRKMVAFGNFPNNTTKTVAHGITNLAQVLWIASIGDMTVSPAPNFYYPGLYENYAAYATPIKVDSTNITLRTYSDARWMKVPYIILTYYKTHDD